MAGEITPFEGLRIISKKEDAEALRVILEGSSDEKVFCDNCEGSKFKIGVIAQGEVTISADSDVVTVMEEKVTEISAVSVLKCAVCGCTDYVIEKEAQK